MFSRMGANAGTGTGAANPRRAFRVSQPRGIADGYVIQLILFVVFFIALFAAHWGSRMSQMLTAIMQIRANRHACQEW